MARFDGGVPRGAGTSSAVCLARAVCFTQALRIGRRENADEGGLLVVPGAVAIGERMVQGVTQDDFDAADEHPGLGLEGGLVFVAAQGVSIG